MLPCQTRCASYQPGCHKTCARWRRFQAEQRTQREAKKRYLRYHTERCPQIARHFQALQVRSPGR